MEMVSEGDRRRNRLFEDRVGDHRNEFQRDRDRVLYSAAFRRLGGVTQVFNSSEGAAFHNRLVHSLKVAQIGRRLAEFLDRPDIANPDVVETAALAHDLGHPPFGHAGEEALNSGMRKLHAAEGFEGNAQTFRILTRLSIRAMEGGLNLTRATLAATIKYPWAFSRAKKKWGAYADDMTAFDFARDSSGLRDTKEQSIEAGLMEWADDVAYSVHDLEDAYRSGLIPLDLLIRSADEWDRFHAVCVSDYWKGEAKVTSAQARSLREAILLPFFDALDRPFNGSREQRAALDELSATLIRRFVGIKGQPALRLEKLRIKKDPEIEADLLLLKHLMRFYVFNSPGLRAQQVGQKRVVDFLLQTFVDATKAKSATAGIVVSPFRERLDDLGSRDKQGRLRLACDIVASMTEQEAMLMFERLSGTQAGSAFDFILR